MELSIDRSGLQKGASALRLSTMACSFGIRGGWREESHGGICWESRNKRRGVMMERRKPWEEDMLGELKQKTRSGEREAR